MKKKSLIFGFTLMLIFSSILVSASLDVVKKEVVGVVIPEIGNNAEYQLTITNNGQSDTFNIYSLVGVDIYPNETFYIENGQSKIIDIQLIPQESIKNRPGSFNFVYKIKGAQSGIQEEVIAILVTPLKDAIELGSYNLDPSSEQATIFARNKVGYEFKNLDITFSSAFFNVDKTFDLAPYEKKEFITELDKSKVSGLVAGSYILSGNIKLQDISVKTESTFKFLEKSSLVTTESSKGIIVREYTIEKKNEGNLPVVATIEVSKNIISRLFTTFNEDPLKVDRSGFSVLYTFSEEIRPGESYALKSTTNWVFPLILLAAILATALLVSIYTTTHLVVKKKVAYVKTKGGEFALKVIISVKAKKFVEKISVIDRVPAILKVYPKFGEIAPSRFDEKNRRIEWNLSSLQSGEERVFSYIVFSKVGVLGKFELPTTTAVFEKDGKLHETESNKVFFMNEVRKRQD